MRWLGKFYPKNVFADRRSAVLADAVFLATLVVAAVLLVTYVA